MADVLTWLFNDGSSSKAGAEAETMSLASLQVLLVCWSVNKQIFSRETGFQARGRLTQKSGVSSARIDGNAAVHLEQKGLRAICRDVSFIV